MSVSAFLDANVLVYAASPGPSAQAKTEKAQKLLDAGDFGLSGQVLAETEQHDRTKIQPADEPVASSRLAGTA